MRKLLFIVFLFCCSYQANSQVYIPMPADSGAAWRYRIYDIDYVTHIFDLLLFLNGQDTEAIGNSYHKIISRGTEYTVPNGTDPAIVSLDASNPDIYYGAIRESGKKVYSLNTPPTGETLLFDFNAGVGDSIPTYVGKVMVTAIDSVTFAGVYHKRYLTTDTGYSVIEGIGSSRGLIPQFDDGSYNVIFYCFTNLAVEYVPDTMYPCTYIYPLGYSLATPEIDKFDGVKIFPIPANDLLHIQVPQSASVWKGNITNSVGQNVWNGSVADAADIEVLSWPKGIYCLQLTNVYEHLSSKIVIN